MTTKIERMQREALEQLSAAVERERAAAAERNALAAACRDVGVSVNRMSAKVSVSRGQIYTWLRSATSGGDAPPAGDQPAGESQAPKTAPSRRKPRAREDT